MNNYKGLYFNTTSEQKYYEGGAHFKYKKLYSCLLNLFRLLPKERLGHPSLSEENNKSNFMPSRNPLSLLKYSTQKNSIINQYNYIDSIQFAKPNNSLVKNKSHNNIHVKNKSEDGSNVRVIIDKRASPLNNKIKSALLNKLADFKIIDNKRNSKSPLKSLEVLNKSRINTINEPIKPNKPLQLMNNCSSYYTKSITNNQKPNYDRKLFGSFLRNNLSLNNLNDQMKPQYFENLNNSAIKPLSLKGNKRKILNISKKSIFDHGISSKLNFSFFKNENKSTKQLDNSRNKIGNISQIEPYAMENRFDSSKINQIDNRKKLIRTSLRKKMIKADIPCDFNQYKSNKLSPNQKELRNLQYNTRLSQKKIKPNQMSILSQNNQYPLMSNVTNNLYSKEDKSQSPFKNHITNLQRNSASNCSNQKLFFIPILKNKRSIRKNAFRVDNSLVLKNHISYNEKHKVR